MSRAIDTQFGLMVPHGRLCECIAFLEDGMRCLASTPYHSVLGKSFLGQADDLAAWLVRFHRKTAATDVKLAAIYLEMNGFVINPAPLRHSCSGCLRTFKRYLRSYSCSTIHWAWS